MRSKQDTDNKIKKIEKIFHELDEKFNALFSNAYKGAPRLKKTRKIPDEKETFAVELRTLSYSFQDFSLYLEHWKSDRLIRGDDPSLLPPVTDLSERLENLVKSHEKLAMKANKFSPHLRDRVKYYLNSIIESLEKLCKAVIAFISSISHKAFKTTKLISSSFDSFKQSFKQASDKNPEASKDLPNENKRNFDIV